MATSDARFRRALLAIVVLAAVLRVIYVLTVTRYDDGQYDATYYEKQARSITAGDGFFIDPFGLEAEPSFRREAADHPPLTVLVLLPAALIDDPEASNLAMRFTMVAIGTATVAAIGVLGRRLVAPAVGLAAAFLAAVDPNLWTNDGLIMSEAPAALIITATLLVAHRLRDRPRDVPLLLALGALTGLAALTRTELALVGPLALAFALRRHGLADAARAGAVVVAAAALVVGPWTAFNLTRFEEPVAVSTNVGLALKAANCDTTYTQPFLGSIQVFPPCVPADDGGDQSVRDRKLLREAVSYMSDNVGRFPAVVAARIGRTWSFYALEQTTQTAELEGRPKWTTWSAAVWTWVCLPLAIFGAIASRRAGRPVALLLVPAAVVTIALAFASGGLLRYRTPAEPGLLVLAVVGTLAAARHLRPDRRPVEPDA